MTKVVMKQNHIIIIFEILDNENLVPLRTRKRIRNPSEHKANVKKRKVQTGQEYVSRSGKIKKQKNFAAQNNCRCKRNCAEHIDALRQHEIFNSFYNLPNWTQKTLFLRSLVKICSVKENLNPVINLKSKNFHNKYYLSDRFGIQHQVCLNFILNCLCITQTKMFHATKSFLSNETAKDLRGNISTRKTKDSDIDFIKDFISEFPTYESHYKVSRSDKKYLSPFLNIKRMYREYCLKCKFMKKKVVKEWKFRHIFNTEFNLSFARPKVDTCRKCDRFKVKLQSQNSNLLWRERIEQKRSEHLDIVQKIKKDFYETVKFACNPENKTEIFTFDLQRALELPCLQTSVAFYKRKLWVYNLCIFDEKRKVAHMYVWNETIASRGSQEVSSCLFKHFLNHVPENTEKIILFSDSCSGQNRNIKISLMLKKFFSIWNHNDLKIIEQRYFMPGHSYNSCDRSFGTIEKQKQITENIFTQQHWVNLMRQAKKTEPKFIVTEMEQNDFFSSKPLEQLIVNRKKSVSGEKINWFNIQKMVHKRENPFELSVFKYSVGENLPANISLKRNRIPGDFSTTKLVQLFDEPRQISRLKYKDIQHLLKFVPEQYHWFYRSIRFTDDDSERDYALAARQSSDEEDSDYTSDNDNESVEC